MKGDARVIQLLNALLTTELTSINQYFLHARMYRNWGLEGLNEKSYKKSIKDMKQADELIERILFLEGLPNLQQLDRIRIGEHTEEMLRCDMDLQVEQLAKLREAIAYCEQVQDYVSRDVLEDILEYEEEHVDWIETQQYLISNAGLENYLQSQMSS
ncbi:bacterioferritin [Parahaliea aestuarii]|uniref:Bacterioferritin n=1 Tax=Parahaliea aestuarii TaxID=1852021 RepID=A0A5C8ZVN9_9GAMM|nr:bacterioferritin [Parahaliea aestuarii]TXS91630.1 bacterioferritin [Parahaliea aestuarii]